MPAVYYSNNVLDSNLNELNFSDLIHYSKNPKPEIKNIICSIRSTDDKGERLNLKKQLPYFTFSKFENNYRKNDNFIETDVLVFDCDNLEHEDLIGLKEQLKLNPIIYLAFVSPSGQGLKFAIKTVEQIKDSNLFKEIYLKYKMYFEQEYNLSLDKTIDPARACFVSYDPDLYLNEDCELIPVKLNGSSPQLQPENKAIGIDAIFEGGFLPGERHSNLIKLCSSLFAKGLDFNKVFGIASLWNKSNIPPLSQSRLQKEVKGVFDSYFKNKQNNKNLTTLLFDSYSQLNKLSSAPINFPKPIITFNDVPFIFPNTFNLIASQKGSFKSFFSYHIISSILSGYKLESLNLRFNSNSLDKEPFIILLDTEQESDWFSYNIQLIRKNSGLDNNTDLSDKFFFASTIDLPFDKTSKFDALTGLIDFFMEKFPNKHFILILDVLQDFIDGNFNDSLLSAKLISFLNKLRKNQDCTIVATIHQNPLSGNNPIAKSKGHLGSMAEEKASMVMSIEKVKNSDGVYEVSFPKVRRIAFPPPMYLKRDDSKLFLVDKNDAKKFGADKIDLNEVCENLFGLLMPKTEGEILKMPKGEIEETLSSIFGVSQRTIRTKINKIMEINYENEQGFKLSSESIGRNKFYFLDSGNGSIPF